MAPRLTLENAPLFERKLLVIDIRRNRTRGLECQLVGKDLARHRTENRHVLGLDRAVDAAALGDDKRHTVDITQDCTLDDDRSREVDGAFEGRLKWNKKCAAY